MSESHRFESVDIIDYNKTPSGNKITMINSPTKWKRKVLLERLFTAACLVALAVFVILYYTAATQSSKNSAQSIIGDHIKVINENGETSEICMSSECLHTASKVMDSMDTSVNPCDDFYKFSCGNFLKTTILSAEQVQVNEFTNIDDKLREQLKIMVSKPQDADEPNPFKLVKNMYASCMNTSVIDKFKGEPIANISEALGGWPVVKGDEWNESNWDWEHTVIQFRKYGLSVDYMLDFSVGPDVNNSSKRIIDIDQADLGLRREYLIKGMDDKIVAAYYSFMVDIAVMFGAKRQLAQEELKESLEFEIKLANISLPQEERRNSTALYNPMTLDALQEKYPYANWFNYVNSMFHGDMTIDGDEVIIVTVPSYFESLKYLLANTSKRTIANYLMWRIHKYAVFYLSPEFRRRHLQYSKSLTGRQEQEPRWKECTTDLTSGSLAIATSALYVREHFKGNAKANAMEMVNDIQSAYEDLLKNVSWMDEETRKAALAKLSKITAIIGYPNELLNNKLLEKFYEKLNDVDPNKYFDSTLKLNMFATNYSFNKLRKPVNKTDWESHSKVAVVNAYYNSVENSIQFPAGILQGKFFSAERPKYMNYGAIGFVIGHEMTHGFDDQGRQFDVNGNLVDWWQQNTKEQFVKKAKCIIDQYGNFTDEETGLNLNGINTQGESIADNGGAKESYIAYSNWVKKNGPEPLLPGLNFTQKQLFWIALAQNWCSVYRLESKKVQITTGVHPPAEFRVKGPLRNMESFSRDFKCPKGSPMNPIKKCEVW